MYTNVNTPHDLTSWNRVCDNIDLIKVPSANAGGIESEIKIYVDKDGRLYYYNNGDKLYLLSTGCCNQTFTDRDIESKLNVGNVTVGDIVPEGSTLTEVVDLFIGTADWTGVHPKAYVFVPQFDRDQPADDENSTDLYLYIDNNAGIIKHQYNLIVKDGYFKLDDQTVLLPTQSSDYLLQMDMSYQHTINISGLYFFKALAARDYGCKDSKGDGSKYVLKDKMLNYVKNIHICDPLLYLTRTTNSSSSSYSRKIIYNDKETSYDFTVNPGLTLSLSIPNGYSYSIKDEYGTSITPSVNGNYYEISIVSTGVTSTFTITLNPNSEENDN